MYKETGMDVASSGGQRVSLISRGQCGRQLKRLYLESCHKVFFLRTFNAKSVLCLFRALKQWQDSRPHPDERFFSGFYREIAHADLMYALSLRLGLFDELTDAEAAGLCRSLIDGDRLSLFYLIIQSADFAFRIKQDRLQKLFGALDKYGCRSVFAGLDPASRKTWCANLDDASIHQLWRWLREKDYCTAPSSIAARQFFPSYDARSWPPATLQDLCDALPKERWLALDLTMC